MSLKSFFTPFSLLTDLNVAYSRPTANPVHAHGTCQKSSTAQFSQQQHNTLGRVNRHSCFQAFHNSTLLPMLLPGGRLPQSFPAHSQFRVTKKRGLSHARPCCASIGCCRVGLCSAGISGFMFDSNMLRSERKTKSSRGLHDA